MSSSIKVFQEPVRPNQIKQHTGQSETDIISQKAVTEKFVAVDEKILAIREVPDGIEGQVVGFDAQGNPIAVENTGGGGTGVFAPVADIAALKAQDTTDAALWPDKWVIYVEAVKYFYALDRESTAAADGDTVIQPTTGAGRWLRKIIQAATENNDGLMPKEAVKDLKGLLTKNNETVISTTGILNDLVPATGTLRFTGGAAVSISGMSSGVDGKTMLIVNATAYDLTLMHENAGSVAGNRLIIQGSDNVYIRPGGAARFRYSASKTAWQMTDLWGSEYFPTMKGVGTRVVEVDPNGYAQPQESVEYKTWLMNQSTALTKAELNSQFPNHTRGLIVVCPLAGVEYEKLEDTNGDWISRTITNVA
jgi:hypothetical protein